MKRVITVQRNNVVTWNLGVDDSGGLYWMDEGGFYEMSLNKQGTLGLTGGILIDQSETIPLQIDAPFPSDWRSILTAERSGVSRWHLMSDGIGNLVLGDETVNDAEGPWEMVFQKTGQILIKGGFQTDNSTVTPTARAGALSQVLKPIISGTQGVFDWHIMINKSNGDLVWADANATSDPGQGHEEMYLTGGGTLNVRQSVNANAVSINGGRVFYNNSAHIPVANSGAFGVDRREYATIQRDDVVTWHMMTDSVGNILWGDEVVGDQGHLAFDWEFAFQKDGSLGALGGFYTVSDRRLKKNIESVEPGILEKVTALRPVRYHLLGHEDTEPRALGLVSQEVEELFPEFVTRMPSGGLESDETLSLSYDKIGVVAVGAIKELNEKSDREDALLRKDYLDLKEENASLKQQLTAVMSRLSALESRAQ